MDMLTQLLSVS